MGLESATLIKDLNESNPAPGDNKAEGDDHLRLLKRVMKRQFPNLEVAVTKTAAKLNADNRESNSTYEQIRGNAPMLEYHRPGQVAFATLVGGDNRWYLHLSGGSGNLSNPLFSMGPGGDASFNNAVYVANSITCAYSVIRANGAVSQTMAINGRGDRNLHRNADAMGFLGLDGNWNLFSHDNGDLWARANISGFSDERTKKNWESISDEQLLRFSRVKLCGTYADKQSGIRRAGMSAQKLRKILPEAVTKNEGLYGIAYGQAALALVHKLSQKVFELERRLEEHGL